MDDLPEKSWDFDSLLPQIGEFGRYQKILIWLICLPACIPCGFHAFNQLFMAQTPDHWCRYPDINSSISLTEKKMTFIPHTVVDGEIVFSKCTMFIDGESNGNITNCQHGWEFDTSVVSSSIVIDFELVCGHALYPTIALSVLNIGGIIGVYVFGIISDRYGRRTSFFLCLSTEILGGLLTALAPNYWMWVACRFIVGLTIPAIYQIPFIIALELVGPTYRTFVTVMSCLFYTLGVLLLAAVAYFVRDWITLSYATTLPFLTFFIYLNFLPESPRWLMSQGHFDDVCLILKKAAKINGKELSENFMVPLKRKLTLQRTLSQREREQRQKKNPISVASLFRTPNMRLKTLLITFNWFANNTVYVGLSYYGPVMGSNEYLSFFLSGVVEIPGYLLCWAVMDRWGRRWPLCLLMVLGGLFCVATVLMPPDAVTATLILYLIAKFAIAASFLILYPFAGELYPTEIRGLGIGFTAYIGGIGLVVIPFINYMGTDVLILPLVIMGVVSAIGGIVGLRLPETLFQKLPQTLQEGEEFGKDFGMEQCLQCCPPRPHDTIPLKEIKTTDPDENSPLQGEFVAPAVRRSLPRILVHQMSSLELPVDSNTGTLKLHYWY